MLSNTEKLRTSAILKNTDNRDNSLFLNFIKELLDDQRIEDIPDAVEGYLSSADVNISLKRRYIHASIVGPIINHYILPKIRGTLSSSVESFFSWCNDPDNQVEDLIRNGMKSGANLKAAVDGIIAKFQCFVTPK